MKDKVNPGEGYRILKPDEYVRPGDECGTDGSHWSTTALRKDGAPFKAKDGATLYRRRIIPVDDKGGEAFSVPIRKHYPLASGLLDYFPDALMAVAQLSYVGNEQHNPGKPMHWDRDKSGDEADALMRHLKDRGGIDTDGVRHSVKAAWRALALAQKELERAHGLPISRASKKL